MKLPRFVPWVYWPSRFASWLLGKLWLRFSTEGRQHVPQGGAFVVVANHQSGLDPLVLGVGIPAKMVFLARSTLRRWPLMGWWMGSVGTIPVDRDAPGRRSIDAMVAVLQSGRPVGVFPEGTRSRDGSVAPFRRGLVLVLKRCPVPVVPAGLHGTMAALPRGRFLPRPARCTMRIGAPLAAAEVLAPGGLERLRRQVAELASAPLGEGPDPRRDQVGTGPDPVPSDTG